MTSIGRPTAYRPEFCELAHNYCLLGATNPELAEFLDVGRAPSTTGSRATPRSPRRCTRAGSWPMRGWRAASTSARSATSSKVERTVLHDGQERTLTNVVHYPPDTRACIFWLRNRRRATWSEKQARPGRTMQLERSATSSRWPARRRRRTRPPGADVSRALPCRAAAAPTFWPTLAAQAARFLRASPMPSQLEPMKIRSMPRKMPSV